MKNTLSLTQGQFDHFDKKFQSGDFGSQRYGQAFFNYFQLDMLGSSVELNTLYMLDGEKAKAKIRELFAFS